MDVYIDIETLRSQEEHRLQILEDVKANFKAPSGITKGAMAKDLGLDGKEAKFAYDKSYQIVKRLIDDCDIYDLADILQTLPPQKASAYIMSEVESLCGVELDQMLGQQ